MLTEIKHDSTCKCVGEPKFVSQACPACQEDFNAGMFELELIEMNRKLLEKQNVT